MTEEREYTPKEIAELLRVSDESIYLWLRNGTIQRYRQERRGLTRKRYFIPKSEIQRLKRIAGLTEESTENSIAQLADV